VEEELLKLVCEPARRGRPAPRFVLLGYDTYSKLRRELMGECTRNHDWGDLQMACPIGMLNLAVDETRPIGMLCVYHAKHMRPR
jgi:hypothetical protein